jgi:ATP adenylyltransferase/5',5'''-P-1,P-4-tetraphosphate phosphorylase II
MTLGDPSLLMPLNEIPDHRYRDASIRHSTTCLYKRLDTRTVTLVVESEETDLPFCSHRTKRFIINVPRSTAAMILIHRT